ncbi:hypothetical protein MJM43_32035, partial [Salmonella enterica subsp. enterica serovar Montevideo]|nr:hypothetical protein [Salmonella enterica subsp. enterica serovar Montevideo]
PLAIAATPIKTEYSGEIQPLVDVEKEIILAALEKTGGNKTEARHVIKMVCYKERAYGLRILAIAV